ncbi:hypothetical protein EGX65_25550 [Escherichia coli]|nr:hypothetical protein [Escherichia coli]EEY5897945.1 hypothetical protein [Escherichia coli]EFB9702157.1 hypothetical protein [Escherichia coli]EFN7310915.1 hypothetical protein [Escherichia coli]EFN7679421.1 hypothetical protein [Escherichia coli]
MAVQQNAWSGHSPDTSDELQGNSGLNQPFTHKSTGLHRGTQKYTCSLIRRGVVGSTGQGIKNPRVAQPALHKIPLCGEYCSIKNPRCSSRKTRVCSHAPDAHTPRKTNFLLICL